MRAEADIPEGEWEKEKQWASRMGLTGADSIEDRPIPTFARAELPHSRRYDRAAHQHGLCPCLDG